MTIETQDGYDPGDDPAGVPLIGYDNQISTITASSEDVDHPANNLLNSATHLFWQAEDESNQTILVSTGGATTDYLAVAAHNLFTVGARVGLGTTSSSIPMTSLLHFDHTDASTQFQDSSGNDYGWNAIGNAQIDTAQFKFGTASCLFDGTGDGLRTSGSQFAFGANDFTFDCWIRRNASGVAHTILDTRTAEPSVGLFLSINTSNVLVLRVNGSNVITGVNGVATGTWLHVALTRTGGTTRLFFQGFVEGSFSDANVYVAGSTARVGLAFDGSTGWNGWIDEVRVVNGLAAWTTTFTTSSAAYADGPTTIVGGYQLLLNFDGVDGSTTITDSGGANHTLTANNGAQLDTAQFKFGTASCLFDGTNDNVTADGSEDFAFGDGNFTIEFWARWNNTAGQQVLYDSRPNGLVSGPYIAIYKASDHSLRVFVSGADVISGAAAAVTTGIWYHIALTRSGSSLRLFLDGVQQGSTASNTTVYFNGSSRPMLGQDGSSGSGFFNGWLDQVRVIKGAALWTSTFVPSSYPINALSSARAFTVEDGLPIIFRFSPTTNNLALTISGGTDPAEIAVIYAGELLVLERSIKVDVGHFNVSHARRSNILAGMSESGNFLGRILLAEWRESQADFAWFTPDWYRSYFEPFVQSALTEPFFWVWNPDEYPDETAFAWLIDDVRPETDPATRRVAATIFMRAIA